MVIVYKLKYSFYYEQPFILIIIVYKMKIAIIGSDGQIGKEFVKFFNSENLIKFTRTDFDIEDHIKVRKKLEEIRPEILINTAAFHRVDECERNSEKAFAVNSLAIKNLAQICDKNNIALVHFSTDYVFDGNKNLPYEEHDEPCPINIYGLAKLEGEKHVRNVRNHLLIRTAYVFGLGGSSQKRTNLVETLLNVGRKGDVKAVYDHIFSPTYAKDLVIKIAELLKKEKFGLYHLTNQGECSVYDFARKIYEIEGINPIIEKISLMDINSNPGKAKRPRYSALTSINLKRVGISPMRKWDEALEAYLKARREDEV